MSRLQVIEAIQQAQTALTKISSTSRLDAELIVALAIGKDRAYLYTYPATELDEQQQQQLNLLIKRRCQGEPMAYLSGYQEFWSLKLKVTADTLIPRPETEHLVEWILQHFSANSIYRVADLGTGSGAIAIAIAYERPLWQIDATDNSASALVIARENAKSFSLTNIHFYQGNWCDALKQKNYYHIMVANPPYIAEHDPHLAALKYEPCSALSANENGLAAIRQIISQALVYLLPNGWIILEHGYDQALEVINLLATAGFHSITSHKDLSNLPRFVTAQKIVSIE